MKRRDLVFATPALVCLPSLLQAQGAYPAKPIRYIVPVAAGGGSDMVGRTVTERWGKLPGQKFIVDNQGGGGSGIACPVAARAAPDGYTLMQGTWRRMAPARRRASCPTTRSATSRRLA